MRFPSLNSQLRQFLEKRKKKENIFLSLQAPSLFENLVEGSTTPNPPHPPAESGGRTMHTEVRSAKEDVKIAKFVQIYQ